MAFPYVLESNFEQGTNAEWTSETDTGSQLDFPHASVLAGVSGLGPMAPFRGAYCARWTLGANTTDAYLTSTTIDIADGSTASYRWYLYLAENFQFTADDVVSLFKLTQAGGGTVEYTIGLNLTAADDTIFLGGSDGTAAGDFGATSITRNKWHAIEVTAKVSTTDAGTLQVYLDGALQVSLDTLDQGGAVGDGVLGIMDRLSTTTGVVLMDNFIADDLRIYPIVTRYPRQLLLTKTAHAFIGPGIIENVTLMSGSSTDSVVAIYDTNRGNTSDVNKLVLELKGIAANDPIDPAGVPVYVSRGAYVVLTGTAPRAMMTIHMAPGYGSEGAVRGMASRLRVNPLEVL